jgi:adenosylhomocysteine nucleosidase
MGKVNAGVCAEVLISHFQVSKIINTGVAGSLSKDLHVGDVVVSTDAVQHDYDLTPIGYPKGEIPDTGRYAFEADKELRESAMRIIKNIDPELNVMEGRICSGDQFISSVADRETITNNFGGLCCEMEGGAIAHVCYLNDTPFIIIRAISDNADGTGGDEYLKNKDVIAERSASIVWTFVEEL